MTAMIPFLFEDEQLVRSVLRAGEPWFVLADVCRVLEIGNPSDAARRLDDDERTTADTLDIIEGIGGCAADRRAQSYTLINESGLYTLILRSHGATTPGTVQHRFRKWVTAEVLPTIRKTGGYGAARDARILPALNRHALELMDRLKRETNPAIRRSIHEMLTAACQRVGIATPPLDAIGADAVPPPTAPEILAGFWTWLGALEDAGIRVNHATDPALIALNLPELAGHARRTGGMAIDTALRRALRLDPRFVAQKAARSAIHGGTVKVWVFRRANRGA